MSLHLCHIFSTLSWQEFCQFLPCDLFFAYKTSLYKDLCTFMGVKDTTGEGCAETFAVEPKS